MYKIFINNEEVVCESSFDIEEELSNPSSIVLSKVYPKSWKGTNKLLTNYYFPQDYSKCKILKNNELYFIGIVKNSADMVIDPRKPHYCSLQVLDFTSLLSEGDTLDYVITNKTVKQAIKQVVGSVKKYGFILGNININDEYNTLIGAYSTNEKAPYDVLQYLALISQSKWSTRVVDESTVAIDFIDYNLETVQGTIDNTVSYFENNRIMDINYSYSTSDYRNKQIITSEEIEGNVTQYQSLRANGYDTSFTLEQKISKISDIKIDNISQVVLTKGEYDLGLECDFYYEKKSNTINSVETISNGKIINVSYLPIVTGREVSSSATEISRIRNNLNIDGTISRYENRSDATSNVELNAIANSYIKYNSKPAIELTITSKIDFLKLGKIYSYSPFKELSGNYLVAKKVTSVLQAGSFIQTNYEYTLNNTFNTENEINFFDNQRAKNVGNIEEGSFITRNIDIEDTANIIFKNLTINELVSTGNNVLDCPLDCPFIF